MPDKLRVPYKNRAFKFLRYLATVSQFYVKLLYIERLPTIAEIVISPYPTISQQLFGVKNLSFVGDTTGLEKGHFPMISMT